MSKINIIDHKPNQTKPTQKPMIIHHDNDGQLLPFFFFFSLPSFTTYTHKHMHKTLVAYSKKKKQKKNLLHLQKGFSLFHFSDNTHTHTVNLFENKINQTN